MYADVVWTSDRFGIELGKEEFVSETLWYGYEFINKVFVCAIYGNFTSEYTPPLPISSFRSAAKLSPEFSSSILDIQLSLPVHISTCSAYAAMVPLRGLE